MLPLALTTAAAAVPLLCIFAPRVLLCLLSPAFRVAGWLLLQRSEPARQQLRAQVQREEEACGEKRGGENEEAAKGDGDSDSDFSGIVGYFHPFCNAGGGGERVLWAAVQATQQRWPRAICAVYTGDTDVDKEAMLRGVCERFNIHLHAPRVHFVYLRRRAWVLASRWPRCTLAGQSLGSLVLAAEALGALVPDVFVDTMGYAFALALVKLVLPAVPTGAYVHFPTISTDMLGSLDDATGTQGVNAGAGAGARGWLKRRYWLLFARAYGWTGGLVDEATCNSSWTADHLRELWGPTRAAGKCSRMSLIYPPIAVTELISSIEVSDAAERAREPVLVYLAQFRPEKQQAVAIRAFAKFMAAWRREHPDSDSDSTDSTPRLVLIGSVRRDTRADEENIARLRALAAELGVGSDTEFVVDAPWPKVRARLGRASVGVNTMWNEHFGMGVVEYQAAGLVAVVNASGGPYRDIVVDLGRGPTGFSAADEDGFAAAFAAALAMPPADRVAMRLRARESARRFTEEEFMRRWNAEVMAPLVARRRGSLA
ncbi:asparagine-linked glycosylation protein [Ascosphaera acerosa]|nr:asparagine-linked glycosylation protein [Ascosphaera acerosa]